MDVHQNDNETVNNIVLQAIGPKEVKSLRDIAIDTIRDAIVSGELAPGLHLKERELSAIMGISTTPIKEALRVLEQMGFVKTVPRKGTFVSDVINGSLSEFFMIRASLEGLAARFAAEKMTESRVHELKTIVNQMKEHVELGDTEKLEQMNTHFHNTICEFSENQMLMQILGNITYVNRAFRKRALQYKDEVELGFYEHKAISESICNKNSELSELKMREHILRTTTNVLNNLNSSKGSTISD